MNPLEQLRDIHLPAAIPWWPLAPGWWLLGGLLLAGLLLGWRWWRRTKAPRPLLVAARGELAGIERRYRAEPRPDRLARELSELLRRVCVVRYPRADSAGLTGDPWLALLDGALGGNDFREGSGRALAEAPYRQDPVLDAEALIALVGRWLRALETRR
ncbi:MAG: DUF4381 domain-containing protein [Gammaproteobacteria bacterium]|jgi:hypothetical protein|nr:DUF4381 domain-containing protein [Gammaproteobacteria bacterium]